MTLFPESCAKKGKWRSEIYNYKQLYKNPCVSSTKVKQTMKGSLCYSKSIYVYFKLSESILQELWIFFVWVYIKKVYVYNYNDLENRMSLASRTFNAIAMWLKHSPCSTEWIDIYYKHTCGNIIILWNRSFRMISMRDTKSMPFGNGQLSKTGYKSCLLYYMVTSIEQKVFTFKHGLNIGRSIYQYRLLTFHLQAQ